MRQTYNFKYWILFISAFIVIACDKELSTSSFQEKPVVVEASDSISTKEVISSLISKISSVTMSDVIKDLTSIPSRYTHNSGCLQAKEYLINKLKKPGWNVTTDSFQVGTTTAYNIIAEKKGTKSGDKSVIISAHYDSWDGGNAGANDNASGCAGLVAIAECLSDSKYSFHHTIRLIAFSGEELGLLGSTHYVQALDTSSLLAVINLDGIAPKTTELTSILISYKRNNSNWLVDSVNSINRRYVSLTGFQNIYVYNNHHWGTDTDPFWSKGFSGVWILGNGEFPYANTLQDTFDKVDPVYGSRLVKTVAAVAFTLAEPICIKKSNKIQIVQ